MRIRALFELIDPELGLTQLERARVQLRALQTHGAKRRLALAGGCLLAGLLLVMVVATGLTIRLLPEASTFVKVAIPVGATVLLVGPCIPLIARWAMKAAIDQAVDALGYAACRGCGDRLQGRSTCARCGERRDTRTCFECGHSLPDDGPSRMRCPECGIRQGLTRSRARRWWKSGTHVDPTVTLLPIDTWRRLTRSGRRRSVGRIAVGVGLAGVLISAIVAWSMPFEHREIAMVLLIFVVFVVDRGMPLLIRHTYGTALRREVRRLGFEICIGCGVLMQGAGDEVVDCPECGRSRQPLRQPPVEGAATPSAAELAMMHELRQSTPWTEEDETWDKPPATPLHHQIGAVAIGLFGLLLWLSIAATPVLLTGWESMWASLALLLAPITIGGLCLGMLVERGLRRPVFTTLRRRGHDVCAACGSWLRGAGLQADQCPFCRCERKEMIAEAVHPPLPSEPPSVAAS